MKAMNSCLWCGSCGEKLVIHTRENDKVFWFPVSLSCGNSRCPEFRKKYKIPDVELEEIKE
jgi:hypothetical protein